MLSNANLWHRHDFWAKIVSTAPYLVNWSPHSIDFKILEEAWPGDPIEYSIMRVFRCLSNVHVNDGKLASRAIKCMFLIYAYESKRYRLWCLDSKKII